MLTGIGENLNQMTSPLYGADAYIDKPFDFGELDQKIREALAARASQRGGIERPVVNGVSGPASAAPKKKSAPKKVKAAPPAKAAAPKKSRREKSEACSEGRAEENRSQKAGKKGRAEKGSSEGNRPRKNRQPKKLRQKKRPPKKRRRKSNRRTLKGYGFRLLPIAKPCNESFAAMPGDESKRFCESCNKHVHDISEGTEEDARALFAANRGHRVCVRFAKDSAGNVRFRSAVIAAAAISLAACGSPNATSSAVEDPSSIDRDMGDAIPDVDDVCPDDPTQADIDDGCPEIGPENALDAGADAGK